MAKIECKGCTPNCPYFPYMDGTVDWEYNEEGLKVRKKKKIFVCSYDGHQIINWTDACPKELDKILSEKLINYKRSI